MSESVLWRLDGPEEPGAQQHMKPLDRATALRLLTSVTLGRLFFTQQALPAVRPVIHVLDGEDVVVRLSDAAALAAVTVPADGTGAVVAFEADAIDPERHLGWSVVVTGYARRVDDPAELERFGGLLRPWAPGTVTGTLRIRPDLVTGIEFVDAAADG
ncbi:pyridoxamine 5'-phosphate oxidase family protein [Streptomyces sp. WMMB 322]|uniref:pyridoxamine 5'-phosphate oxidase family protein n=1 Tax=Streptomyces sp. WMMB 322 TaxID=1286821 RepID=UPI00099ED1D2|nr:pyridoxamine 5'-phosphate oxidase family protein [Streptomyces sp. WMMB 322]